MQTFKTWRTPEENEVRVYIRPNDGTETNRVGFMEKFTVGAEIFDQLLLINNMVDTDSNEQAGAREIPLPNVESHILTALINFASWNSENQIELDSFRYL